MNNFKDDDQRKKAGEILASYWKPSLEWEPILKERGGRILARSAMDICLKIWCCVRARTCVKARGITSPHVEELTRGDR